MENSNHKIDQIIRNKLIDYEEDVSADFWTRLSARLSKRRIINGMFLGFFILCGLVFWMMIPDLETSLITNNENAIPHNYSENQITPKTDNKPIVIIESSVQQCNNAREVMSKNVKKQVEKETSRASINQENHRDKKTTKDVSLERIAAIQHFGEEANSISLLKKKNKVLRSEKVENFTMKEMTSQKNVSSRFSVSLEAGFGITWKNLKSDPQYEELVNFRNANETSVSNAIYGIMLNYHYKNWIIGTGLEYTSLGEKLNYHVNENVIDPEGGYYRFDTLWLNIYDNGNFIPTAVGSDAIWVDEYKEVNHLINNINQYNYLEIPLKVGYKFHSQKIALCPVVGISIGLLYSSNGRLPELNTSNFAEVNKTNNYLKPVTTHFIFELGFEYKVSPNYGLYIKPYYRKGIKSLFLDYPITGRYHTAGLKFGVNIYL